jgi:hypothetical protein
MIGSREKSKRRLHPAMALGARPVRVLLSRQLWRELVLFGFTPKQFEQADQKRKAFEAQGKKVKLKTIELKRAPRGLIGGDKDR